MFSFCTIVLISDVLVTLEQVSTHEGVIQELGLLGGTHYLLGVVSGFQVFPTSTLLIGIRLQNSLA